MSKYHVPVLLEESIAALQIKEDGTYVDATFGGGVRVLQIVPILPRSRPFVGSLQDRGQSTPAEKRQTHAQFDQTPVGRDSSGVADGLWHRAHRNAIRDAR